MSDKKVLGVCAWLSKQYGLDVTGLRILFVVAAIFGLGSPILVYLVLYLVMPKGD